MTTDDPYRAFAPSSTAQQRRKIAVAQLTARMPGYEWAAILNNAYLTEDGVDVSVVGFRELLGELSGSDAIRRLDEIRRSGYLTEGARGLPPAIISCMSQAGKQPFLVRSLGSLESKPITAQQMARGAWAGDVADEVEICDEGSRWYLRVRDDDPLIFLYADAALLDEIEKKSPEYMLRLPDDFVYAY